MHFTFDTYQIGVQLHDPAILAVASCSGFRLPRFPPLKATLDERFVRCCAAIPLSAPTMYNACQFPPFVPDAQTKDELAKHFNEYIGCFTNHNDNRHCCLNQITDLYLYWKLDQLYDIYKMSELNGTIVQPSSSPKSHWSKLARMLRQIFPAVTEKAILRHYIPMSGAVSHSLFTMHIFAPSIFTRLFSVYDLALSNAVLFNAHLGLGFYMYYRPHMHRLWRWRRVEFSVFASVIFNFGSLLLSIFLKDFLPQKLKQIPRALIGIALSCFMLHRARRYVHYIDQRAVLPSLGELKNSTAALFAKLQKQQEKQQEMCQQNGHSPTK